MERKGSFNWEKISIYPPERSLKRVWTQTRRIRERVGNVSIEIKMSAHLKRGNDVNGRNLLEKFEDALCTSYGALQPPKKDSMLLIFEQAYQAVKTNAKMSAIGAVACREALRSCDRLVLAK